jgi:hypothetical protein
MRGVLVGSEASLLYATDSFTTPELCAPLFLAIDVRDVFSLRLLFSARERLPLLGLIWPKTGCAAIA